MLTLFGQQPADPSKSSSTGEGTGTGTSGLFSGLNAPTTDAFGKRKSIFEPSTSQTTPSPLFGGLNAATSAAPSGGLFAPKPASASASPFSLPSLTTTSAPATGLFGATTSTAGAQPAATSSIFGAPASTQVTQQPATSSLFGAPTATQQPAATSLLGAPATTQQPASTSLFGAPTTAQPSTSSLFGATTTQPAAASSMFGATAGASQANTHSNAPPVENTRDAAYFSTLLERQKKKPKLSSEYNGRHELPSLGMDLGDLARRAQEIRQRGARQAEPLSDSRAHYLLAGSGVAPGQAYKDFQALGPEEAIPAARVVDQSFADESSAYLRDVKVKGRDAMLRESMERVYREVDSFIEESLGVDFEEQKMRIMEHFGLALPDDNASVGGQGSVGFGKSSRRAKNGTADISQPTRSIFGRTAMEKSIIGTAGSGAGTLSFFKSEGAAPVQMGLPRSSSQVLRELRNKEKVFIGKVEDLNQARLRNEAYPLFRNFGETEQQNKADSPRQLVDAYEALREIIKEEKAGVKERHFIKAYLDETSSNSALMLRKQIIEGSREYLEKAFWRELKAMVDRNPRDAQIGGQPTILNIVRGYIRIRAARRDLAPDGTELNQIGDEGNKDYCWALVFYLLRCGFVKEAAEYVTSDPSFQSMERRFVSYMSQYAEPSSGRRLSRKLHDMIQNEYQNRTQAKTAVDPYRIACYKIIGRCDLGTRNLDAIGQGVEDWLWLQFVLARESEQLEEISGDIYGLEQICETVTEIGQKHFQKSQIEGTNAYGTYFLMQVLAGMFEQAVDYLHNFNPLSAVHFSIALSYYGLLRISDFSVAANELLTFSTTQRPMINFVPLVAYHTGTFRTALPVAAVDYLALICLNSDLQPTSIGQVQTGASHECLRELCLETREFAKLLGDIRSDGTRIPGAIELRAKLIHLETREEFLSSITRQSAAIADQRGQIADAVLLYHLCEDYDSVVGVLNRALADAVTIDLGQAPMQLQPLKPRQANGKSPQSSATEEGGPQSSLSLTQSTSSPMQLAENMTLLYNSNAAYFNRISPLNREICSTLLGLLQVRELLESSPPQYIQALELLNGLNQLPLQAGGSIPIIRAAASAFATLPQVVARCAGISIVWAVRAIGGERDRLNHEGRWEAGLGGDANEIKDQLSSMAKDLMVFAGLVKYKLPGRVYDMLTRAGAEVGGF